VIILIVIVIVTGLAVMNIGETLKHPGAAVKRVSGLINLVTKGKEFGLDTIS